MLYTVGHTVSYEKFFEEQECPRKMGRDKNLRYNHDKTMVGPGEDGPYYEGGIIFITAEHAATYILDNDLPWSVYGVECDNNDVSWYSESEGNLIKTSNLKKI